VIRWRVQDHRLVQGTHVQSRARERGQDSIAALHRYSAFVLVRPIQGLEKILPPRWVRWVRLSESAQTRQTTRWNDNHHATQITRSRLKVTLGSTDSVAVLNAGLAQKYRALLRARQMESISDVGGDRTSNCTVGYQWSSTRLLAAMGCSRALRLTSKRHDHGAHLQT
jgi:hypothetical protein